MGNLLKYSVSAIFLVLFYQHGISQWCKMGWSVEISYSMLEHDKRLFGFPATDRILIENPERFGTTDWTMQLHKSLISKGCNTLDFGIGLSREQQTFPRPYRQNVFGDFTEPLNYITKYRIITFNLPITYLLRLKWLYLKLNFLPKMSIFKLVSEFHKKSEFEFYSIELNPQIGARFGGFEPFIGYRLTQIKKRDEVYVYPILWGGYLPYPEYERNNPVKFTFGLRYHLTWECKEDCSK